jgi:DNA-binding GntR family transcriptional regulator
VTKTRRRRGAGAAAGSQARPAPSAPERRAGSLADAIDRVPVPRRSIGDVVADHIRQLVFAGALRDGQRVPQRQIAEELGVSSVPVREALVALQREGVVTIELNRGAFVNGLTPDVVTEQFYVFGRAYGFAIRRAAERAEPGWIDELAALAKRIRTEPDLDKSLAVSIRFQQKVIELGGSKRLPALMRPLWHFVPGNFYVSIPGSLHRTRRGVSEIIAAMRAGEPDRAEQAAWSMMTDIGGLFAEQLRRRTAG